jgi:hypothetical protein
LLAPHNPSHKTGLVLKKNVFVQVSVKAHQRSLVKARQRMKDVSAVRELDEREHVPPACDCWAYLLAPHNPSNKTKKVRLHLC